MNADVYGILAQFEEIYKRANSTLEKLSYKTASREYSQLLIASQTIEEATTEAKAIQEAYQDAIAQFIAITIDKKINVTLRQAFGKIYDHNLARSELTKIALECQKAVGVLKNLFSPLPKEQMDKLDSLRGELVKIKNIDIDYERNLNEGIEEFEKGRYLAASLISSRVVAHSLDLIKGENDEDKVDSLIKQGKIKRDDKATKSAIIKASRLARNIFSHDIKAFPSPEETLSLLSEAIRITKLNFR